MGRFLAMRREGGEDWTADTEKRGEGTAADILLPALIVPKEISRSRRRRSIKWPLRAIQEKKEKEERTMRLLQRGKIVSFFVPCSRWEDFQRILVQIDCKRQYFHVFSSSIKSVPSDL